MASSSLDKETRKILSRWAKNQWYVYLRPMTSRFVDVTSEHRVYWVVAVEFRTTPPGQWRREGYDLDEVIRLLDLEVPHNRKAHHDANVGWLAPEVSERPKAKKKKKIKVEAQVLPFPEQPGMTKKIKKKKSAKHR